MEKSTIKRGIAAAALAMVLLTLRKKKPKKSKGDEKDGRKKKRKQDPMMQIFWILWPFQKEKRGLKNVGQLELLAIFMVSVLRTWHQNRMVYIKSSLMEATYRRDVSLFRKIIKETIILSALSSFIFAAHRFLKERLTLVWRDKLTKELHSKYFNGMNYYKLSHLSNNSIPDIEERLTKDPRRFCKGLADEMEKLSAAATSGIWFTYKLYYISSLPYAISPLLYFYMAFRAAVAISPDWSKRWRKMLDLNGIYVKAQNRLQAHAEAICAYKGHQRERVIIQEKWKDSISYAAKFVRDASVFQFVTGALFEYGGHSFAEALIVGMFVKDNHPAKEMLRVAETKQEKVAAIAYFFTEVRFVTEYFIRAMSAQGTVIAVLRQLQAMKGPAKRLTQLFDALDNFDEQSKEVQGTRFIADDGLIKFENVQVFTPTNHLLVKDLSFEIRHGQSLLLTGCNGSGKSSIFRCLGALWHVPSPGVITKPGGGQAGLNKLVFYLPQKPYNVLGTLRAQIAYPDSNCASLSVESLRMLLEEVDLGYLISRDDDLEHDWENELSLGEKQRLAMARLLHHNPKYAILDECTSGVSAGMERKLYKICRARNISCITISHRPVLKRFHDICLNILADGKGSWTLENISNDHDELEDVSGADKVGGYSSSYMNGDKVDAALERQRLDKRSKPYQNTTIAEKGKDKGKLFKFGTFRRLKDLMQIFLPDGASLADPCFRLAAKMAALIVVKTMTADATARVDGMVVATSLQNTYSVFAKVMALATILRTCLAYLDARMFSDKWTLNLMMRERLTAYLTELYFTKNTFYDMKQHDARIPDPEERITEQVAELSISMTELWTALLKPAFDIGFNSVVLYKLLGVRGVAYTTGYMLIGGLLLRHVVPNFRLLQKQTFNLEGRFRFVHTRLVQHTESIAFFGGDAVEHAVANERFNSIKSHSEAAQVSTLRFNIFSNFAIKQTPDLVAFALRMLFAQGFSNDTDVLAMGKGSDVSSKGEYIQQTVMRSFKSFGDAFDLQETIGNFIGTVENVTDFMYTLQDLASESQDSQSPELMSDENIVRFEDVDIVAPGGTCVASNLNLTVRQHESLVVTGPNASGKSSLFRLLGGLWSAPKGRIIRPKSSDGKQGVFLVPQKPYCVSGTIADQLSYPLQTERTEEHEKQLRELLDLVGIEYLLERYNLWETQHKWEDVLSLGEQQRLNIARLFFHNPKFAVLDECTSAVSNEVEERLYRTTKARGITSITISQRLALEQFHVAQLSMGDANGDDGWMLTPLGQKPKIDESKQQEKEVEKKTAQVNGKGKKKKKRNKNRSTPAV